MNHQLQTRVPSDSASGVSLDLGRDERHKTSAGLLRTVVGKLRGLGVRWRVLVTMSSATSLIATGTGWADTIRVDEVHYLPTSGAIAALVAASGPADTAVAISLYRTNCPAAPAEADTQPGVLADGEPHTLLANPPSPGESGRFVLCVWTVHEDGVVGARHAQLTSLPPSLVRSWSPTVGTDHPWWWVLLGWGGVLTVVGVLLLGGARVRRTLKARRARSLEATGPFGAFARTPPLTAATPPTAEQRASDAIARLLGHASCASRTPPPPQSGLRTFGVGAGDVSSEARGVTADVEDHPFVAPVRLSEGHPAPSSDASRSL